VKPNIAEESPYRETINGIRAIAPVVFFFILGRFVIEVRKKRKKKESTRSERREEKSPSWRKRAS
jgi:hypothetical protein